MNNNKRSTNISERVNETGSDTGSENHDWDLHSDISSTALSSNELKLIDIENTKHATKHSMEINYNDSSTDLKLLRTKSNRYDEPIIDNTAKAPYSRFGPRAKFFLVMQCAFSGFFSTIGGSIYYPVLTVIEDLFHITEEQVNITVVVYFIFQALTPTLMGGLADSLGRRPVALFSLLIFFAACCGLACSQNYTQIMVLRCLQAASISPVVAINSGIMGDITTRAERGAYVGYTSGFQVLGNALGSLIGAFLAARWNWRATFWFLAIGSGAASLISCLCLPETKRTIVGNGSIMPHSFVNKAPILNFSYFQRKLHIDDPDYETLEPKVKINFLAPLKVLKIPQILIILFVAGFQFAMYSLHQTSLTTSLSKDYGCSVVTIGLCFLPTGLCTLAAIISTGRFLNWQYRREFNKYKEWLKNEEDKLMEEHHNLDKVKEIIENDQYYTHNIAKTRLQPAFYTFAIGGGSFLAFGWCLQYKAPLGAVLVTSGLGSFFSMCFGTMASTFMVDVFPSIASTATGCMNLVRCLLSAIFIACLSNMTKKMHYGGVFTFITVLSTSITLLLTITIRDGKKLAFERNQIEKANMKQYKEQLKERSA